MSLIDEDLPPPPPVEPEPLMRPYWPLRLAAGLLLLLGAYAFWYEPATLRVVEHRIDMADAFGGPFRIAVIADLHGGAPYINDAKIDRVVALANAAEPDLILLTGDYVTQGELGAWHMPIESIASRLKPLHARLGVFAVLGNHDHWADASRIARALNIAGIVVLEDRAARVGVRGSTFYLAGISDFATAPHSVGGALLGIPVGQKALCFTHSPDAFPLEPETCALTIAGHTHGGQVDLPLLGRLIVPSRYGQRYAAGLTSENGKQLFVSTGIGTSILPVRFGVRPEVTILDIR